MASETEETTETEAHSPMSIAYACTGVFPPKHERSRMSTNQITALLARARFDCTRPARLGPVYKEGPVLPKSFGLGLA